MWILEVPFDLKSSVSFYLKSLFLNRVVVHTSATLMVSFALQNLQHGTTKPSRTAFEINAGTIPV